MLNDFTVFNHPPLFFLYVSHVLRFGQPVTEKEVKVLLNMRDDESVWKLGVDAELVAELIVHFKQAQMTGAAKFRNHY